MNEYIIYYIGGSLILFFFIKKVFPSSVKENNTIYLNKKAKENKEQYKKIALGAIYSQQQMAHINSLNTGLKKSYITNILSEWWGINNAEEAKDKLDYLSNKGFRYYFKTVINAYLVENEEEQKKIVINGFNEYSENYEEDIQKAYNQLINLQETWEELTKNNIILNQEELIRYNNVGWDCGRLVFLSRLCFDAGYINENEVWKYLNEAQKLATKSFSTWKQFSKSYIIGRAMWGGVEYSNEDIIKITNELLKDDKSPWMQLSFM